MQDRIKEHDRGIRLARTETSTVSEDAHNTGHEPLWNEVEIIDRDPYNSLKPDFKKYMMLSCGWKYFSYISYSARNQEVETKVDVV